MYNTHRVTPRNAQAQDSIEWAFVLHGVEYTSFDGYVEASGPRERIEAIVTPFGRITASGHRVSVF